MKTFILTEKPSQAQDFTKGLGEKFSKEDDAYISEHYIICHARGHLVEPKNPDEYDEKYKAWKKEDLPIIPEKFAYKIKKDTFSLFKNIKKHLNNKEINKIVIATDAEREGELIARLILQESGVNTADKQMYRFWTSSALTPDEIRKTMEHLKPLSEYDRYYNAALARQKADWLIGLNATRAATLKARGSTPVSLGRVQTPTLKILYLRYKEIADFVSEKYFEINSLFNSDNVDFKGVFVDDKGVAVKFKTELEATDILNLLKGKSGVVDSIVKKQEKSVPPKLFSLSTLQKEASSKHGIKASETLNILQSLYDDKLTTYPRTDSEVLSEDMVDLSKDTIVKLGNNGYKIDSCVVDSSNKNVFNNAKLTDHHAVIPTGKKPTNLEGNIALVYEMIVNRFLAQFMPNYEYETTKAIIKIGSLSFLSKGQRVIKLGWKELLGKAEDELLPTLTEGQQVEVKEVKHIEKQTTPPPHYTDGTLIDAMNNAAKFAPEEQKELKDALKNVKGIGTPATRAGILEKLLARKYVERKGKNIVISPAGVRLIEQMGDENITDPAWTGLWEMELERIASGEIKDTFNFDNNIKKYAEHLIGSIFSKDMSNIAAPSKHASKNDIVIGKCPVCGKEVITYENAKGFFCSNKAGGCDFVLWKSKLKGLGKNNITDKEAKDIFAKTANNEIIEMKLMTKDGKAYDGKLQLYKDEQYGWGFKLLRD